MIKVNEIFQHMRDAESCSSAEARTRVELHIRKIKSLRERNKCLMKLSPTAAKKVLMRSLAIDVRQGVCRLHTNIEGSTFYKYL